MYVIYSLVDYAKRGSPDHPDSLKPGKANQSITVKRQREETWATMGYKFGAKI